ncbi:MAG: valine--pyruvate transaminase [Chloroflexi bacterium]|jgi:valine--pyruvate aminotransferase|nr:valine--pyruvate transaminase [Chloroflexota bacterium]
MQFTRFGEKFTAYSGILQLMDDLGNAVAGSGDIIMLGGGNPSHIAQVQNIFRKRIEQILANGNEFERLIGNYGPPQGPPAFAEAVATLLQQTYGWHISSENVAITNGSQTAFFYLFNMLAGEYPDGTTKRILLPLAPEYIGYADAGIAEDIFATNKPQFEYLDEHTFKYHVDFESLPIDESISAICVSRPTNPTGNVLTDHEIEKLRHLARSYGIPLIIDNAYGAPFPSIIFEKVTPVWDENIILCLSLSKLGLPGVRTGIVIARKEIAAAVNSMNAVVSLAPSSIGAGLALDMMRTGEIMEISRQLIQPYYEKRAEQAEDWVWEALTGTPFFLHKPEGAFFFWLWFKDFPISSAELYDRLKQRGVLVVPGHYFFPGLHEEWEHKTECIRMNYTPEEGKVRQGIRIIGEEIKRAYAEK